MICILLQSPHSMMVHHLYVDSAFLYHHSRLSPLDYIRVIHIVNYVNHILWPSFLFVPVHFNHNL